MKHLKSIHESRVQIPTSSDEQLEILQNIFSHYVDDDICDISEIPPNFNSFRTDFFYERFPGIRQKGGYYVNLVLPDVFTRLNNFMDLPSMNSFLDGMTEQMAFVKVLKSRLKQLTDFGFKWMVNFTAFTDDTRGYCPSAFIVIEPPVKANIRVDKWEEPKLKWCGKKPNLWG